MSVPILTALITVFGGVFVAGATYWFTKQRERDAELRREKLEHYKEFVASLSGVISGEGTPDGQRAFARASNKLMLIAPQSVIEALRAFQEEIKVSNPESGKHHAERISRLFYEIRRDLKTRPADKLETFEVGLWSSGVPPE